MGFTFAEVKKYQDQLLADPDFNPEFDQLMDGTGITDAIAQSENQAAGSEGLLLKIVEFANCDAFRVARCSLIQNRKIDQLPRYKPGKGRSSFTENFAMPAGM